MYQSGIIGTFSGINITALRLTHKAVGRIPITDIQGRCRVLNYRLRPQADSGRVIPIRCDSHTSGDLLAHDVAVAETSVLRLVKVPLTQGQLDALVHFVFNLGAGRLASSTLLRDLTAGKYDDAASQLLSWDHAGHVEVEGLKKRREAELQLWFNG